MSLIANTLQDPSIPTCALRHCRVDELPGSRQVVIERIANGKLHRSHLHAQELATTDFPATSHELLETVE